jgi:hypothetical protein
LGGTVPSTGKSLEPRALFEANRRFILIEDGVPVMTGIILGQMTCEALALRLMHANEDLEGSSVGIRKVSNVSH